VPLAATGLPGFCRALSLDNDTDHSQAIVVNQAADRGDLNVFCSERMLSGSIGMDAQA
jgi:hypothetical protein